jgi:SAM-dependent methyltransferase
MTDTPHDSWADVYDLAYETSFGAFYRELTDTTLSFVDEHSMPGARIIDFGAGTGRLALPLSQRGFEVTAVEPSPAMIDRLEAKASQLRPRPKHPVKTVRSRMQDYQGNGEHDLALCVFTVLLYLLDEASLNCAFASARDALKPDGQLLLDIPSEHIFSGYSHRDPEFERYVEIDRDHDQIYNYEERIHVLNGDAQWTHYEDRFAIRCWDEDSVCEALNAAGFAFVDDLSGRFAGSGSSYLLFAARQDHRPR